MELSFLTNQHLSDKQASALTNAAGEQEQILFVVVSEISKNDRYEPTALAVTQHRVFTFDFAADHVVDTIAFDSIDEIFTKRMYGNGLIRVKKADGGVLDLFRFTYTVAAL